MTTARNFALDVVRKLRGAGFEALWAGGCVRDQLLGQVPKDYDVATNATPQQVRDLFGKRRTLAIGIAFGVISVLGPEKRQIEVATFRQDAAYGDGRHPDSVTYSSAEEDALRRDFTINGLFYDPLAERVIDYVGGQEDILQRTIRAIGDPYERIGEDRLRMLRAIRFSSTLSFEIDPPTFSAVQRQAAAIADVSAERLAAEMRRMLPHENRRQAVDLLRTSGLLDHLLPEYRSLFASQPAAADDPLHPASCDWNTTLEVLERLDQPSFSCALAGTLHIIDQRHPADQVADTVSERWKLSGRERVQTSWLLQHWQDICRARQLPWPQLQRILIAPGVDQLLKLAEAVAGENPGLAEDVQYCRDKLTLPPDELNPQPLITGEDLLRAGLKAGPGFRIVLDKIRDAQLEQRISNPQEAMRMARKIWMDRQETPPET